MSVTGFSNDKITQKINGRTDVTAATIEEQVSELRGEIAALAGSIASYGQNRAEKLKGKAADAGARIAGSSEEMLKAVRGELSGYERLARRRIREKPLQAVGIAAGIGFVLALLSRR
ncbi:MAG: DUF883 domain-containing protein [Hyphomicrobiales bacterium]